MTFLSRVAILSLVLVAACGKADNPAEDRAGAGGKPPAVTAATSPPSSTVRTGDAVVATGPAAAGVKTPDHAPLYPGAVVITSIVGESGVGAGGAMTFKAGGTPTQVIAFYEAKARETGRPVTMKAAMGGDVQMLTTGDSGEGKGALQVIASPAEGGSEVQMTWSAR
jgi:hypothetical protein